MKYPILIHKDDESDYGVTVPDIPGCFSAGETIDKAVEAVREAIEGHVEILCEDGESIPLPSVIEELQGRPEFSGGIWALVDIDIIELLGKTERFNVTLPAVLVKRVDDFVNNNDTGFRSRSDFLAKAAAEKLNIPII